MRGMLALPLRGSVANCTLFQADRDRHTWGERPRISWREGPRTKFMMRRVVRVGVTVSWTQRQPLLACYNTPKATRLKLIMYLSSLGMVFSLHASHRDQSGVNVRRVYVHSTAHKTFQLSAVSLQSFSPHERDFGKQTQTLAAILLRVLKP